MDNVIFAVLMGWSSFLSLVEGRGVPAGYITEEAIEELIYGERQFGISLGTWASAELTQTASSLRSEYIEIELTEDIVGDRKRLPKGTIFYATGTFNTRSETFDMDFDVAVTPRGEDLKVVGSVFRLNHQPGLVGNVFQIAWLPWSIVNELNVADGKKQSSSIARYIIVAPQKLLIRFNRDF